MAADDKDLQRDPLTDEPGSHPVGTGIGAAGGAVTGAAAGSIAGPIGAMVGGVIGAVVGGLAGKGAAEAIHPTSEEAHWRDSYTREPYYEPGRTFDDYGPAYMHGMRGRLRHESDWEAAEPQLASEWENARVASNLSWDQARPASRAAWDRVGQRRAQVVRTDAVAANQPMVGGTDMVGASEGSTAGADSGDVVDTLQDLVECSKDGEYGFRACAEQASRPDLKALFLQRADDCRRAADELNAQIRLLGGKVEDGGSALGSLHRGWVAARATLTTYDDRAVLQECERGEDNALARYRKALEQALPADIRLLVERQLAGAQRNHDQIRMLRDSTPRT